MAGDSNVYLYVLMWSPRQPYVFFQFIIYLMLYIAHAYSLFHLYT